VKEKKKTETNAKSKFVDKNLLRSRPIRRGVGERKSTHKD